MRESRERDRRFPDGSRGAVLDETPIATAVAGKAKPGLRGQIQEAVRHELLARALADEAEYRETFEESNDFDVGDDYSPEDDFDSDLDPPQETLDDSDELDVRLASSLRRVFESFGMKVSEPEPSAPVSGGEREGDKPTPPPNAEPADD